ncbi:hypothetical protein BX667DRAFT_494240 [Coemansia mojavensis]|nr:hypothetical protein BX667DRAFT_494240 [Coemansia mojavensis]
MTLIEQIFGFISVIYTAILSVLNSVLVISMTRRYARDPASYSKSEKKETLYPLYRRARHLDRKWAITCSKPDEFTILGMLPVFGDSMTTMLAVGYYRRIHGIFSLPEEIEKQMVQNIVVHAGISIIPLAGWILRRLFGVNKRNYMILEKYVMSCASKGNDSGVETL